ncbi:TPA: SUF system NifU family Fe-S cluster assembly protein [Streptococcus equi subsp. zooepidemicus]|uniref:Fe-S cluster assembly sulfur transfer protein SufU n=1 Tax=Streptococcus equi TaxID=1336 RepID=UPI000DA42544|nr:SUF system NifU family Fe-S cluster assembly protein [Streptococcus equi]HEL1016638.1 SUF system NifU family Fe-S cluster assembly protein [Streptococcus equi subsp. ruminatorum]MCD3383397.1 SUF system NifU family Fe-S cluster assembly protein [Streptococcus equi subsp. zooepidemicus]MCD3419332.1 SUF system NifU family Fe-S cluster assembly protein [Streptococcus equi subsp. zooepidemicus]MCD3425944.1 SUF system NifU family Fe-S cluster assembly protein [Streptococcus equi subsp. zooepidemic
MALSKLSSLYMAVVADHSKNPHHYGQLEGVEAVQFHNPTCGDVISLTVKFAGDRIEDIAFAGDGCTISTASSSMMTDAVLGKTKEEALALADIFSNMVQGNDDSNQALLGEAELLAGVANFPQRIKCATLAWHALKQAIEKSDEF